MRGKSIYAPLGAAAVPPATAAVLRLIERRAPSSPRGYGRP